MLSLSLFLSKIPSLYKDWKLWNVENLVQRESQTQGHLGPDCKGVDFAVIRVKCRTRGLTLRWTKLCDSKVCVLDSVFGVSVMQGSTGSLVNTFRIGRGNQSVSLWRTCNFFTCVAPIVHKKIRTSCVFYCVRRNYFDNEVEIYKEISTKPSQTRGSRTTLWLQRRLGTVARPEVPCDLFVSRVDCVILNLGNVT